MLTDEQLEYISDVIKPLFQYLEHEVIVDIARRIQKTMTYTRTAELQAQHMYSLGYSPAKIRSEAMKILNADADYRKEVAKNTLEYKNQVRNTINDITKKAYLAGDEIIANAGMMSWISDLSVWKKGNKELKDDSYLSDLVKAFSEQTNDSMKNLTKSTGFKAISGYESVETAYRKELDKAVIKLCSGTFSQEKVITDVIKDLAHSGLRTIDYASGHSMQLDTAIKSAVRTGCHQISGKIMDKNILNTGVNLVYVAEHVGARNTGVGVANHEAWQGKVYYIQKEKDYTKEAHRIGQTGIHDLWESTGYSVDGKHANNLLGLYGYNCSHRHYPWFEGVSPLPKRQETPKPITINGKEYDYYAMTQKMRLMERNVRALKREKEARIKLNMDTTDIDAKIKQKTREYKDFCKTCGITQNTTNMRYTFGTSDYTKTKTYKEYRNSINDNKKGGIISVSREKYITGNYKTDEKTVNNILNKELSGVKMSAKPAVNNKIKTQGKTEGELYPWGEVKRIKKIEIGKQLKDTRENVIDTILHEELEARIMLRGNKNKFYEELNSVSDSERHKYINKVIKGFFEMKGLDYDKR